MILEMFSLIKARFLIRQINEKIAHHIMPKICFVLLNPGCTEPRDSRNFFSSTDSNHLECAELTRHHVFLFYLPCGMAEFTSRFRGGTQC